MKPSTFSTGAILATLALNLHHGASFDIQPEELTAHSVLARLVLKSPMRTSATRQKPTGMAFLAEAAVEPQVAFLTAEPTPSKVESMETEAVKNPPAKDTPPAVGTGTL